MHMHTYTCTHACTHAFTGCLKVWSQQTFWVTSGVQSDLQSSTKSHLLINNQVAFLKMVLMESRCINCLLHPEFIPDHTDTLFVSVSWLYSLLPPRVTSPTFLCCTGEGLIHCQGTHQTTWLIGHALTKAVALWRLVVWTSISVLSIRNHFRSPIPHFLLSISTGLLFTRRPLLIWEGIFLFTEETQASLQRRVFPCGRFPPVASVD